MTTDDRPLRILADWMAEEGIGRAPADLAARIDSAASERGQRHAWTARWHSPWPRAGLGYPTGRQVAIALVAMAVVLAAAAIALIGARLLRPPDLIRPAGVSIVPGFELARPREGQAAALLADGRLMLASGNGTFGSNGEPSFEVQDPSTGTWRTLGGVPTARTGLSATLLGSGSVLLVGGTVYAHHPITVVSDLVETWDPRTASSQELAPLHTPRSGHTAFSLPDGKVVVLGGVNPDPTGLSEPWPELFDPTTGTFTSLELTTPGPMSAATELVDGRILILGSRGGSSAVPGNPWAMVFDAETGATDAVGAPIEALGGQTATTLPDGRVLIVGGTEAAQSAASSTVQTFDPKNGTFTVVGHLATPRTGQLAVALPDDRVVIIGGRTQSSMGILVTTGTVEVVDPDMAATRVIGNLKVDRTSGATATLVQNGTIVVAGGLSNGNLVPLRSTDVVTPTSR